MALDRRTFMRLGCSATAALIARRSHASTGPEKVLRIGFTQLRGSQVDQMAEAFCREVSEKTGGRIRIDRYYGGALGGEKEIAEDVAAGVIDFGLVGTVGFAGSNMVPKLGVFDIPFLFRDLQHARGVLDGLVGQAALESLRPTGAVGLSWGEVGFRQITTGDKPVRSPKDLAGIKIRVPQSEVMLTAFNAFGADATPLPFAELYTALANGRFQSQENPLNTIKVANFDKVQKYLCLTDHVYSSMMLVVSLRSFEEVAPEDREIFRQAARNATAVARDVNDATRTSDIEELRQRGMTIVSDVDRAAFITASSGIQAKYEAMFDRDNIRAIQNFEG